jgi:hypothetical protein
VTLPEFTIITLGVGSRLYPQFLLLVFLGYYFSESTLVKESLFYNVCTYFVILIVMSAAILKKVITIMKTSDYFAEKIDKK